MAFYDNTGVLQQGSIDDYLTGLRQQWQTDVRRKQSAAHRGKVWKTAAAGAALFGGAVAGPALFGGGTAAGATSLPAAATAGMAPASVAATSGGGMTLGGLLGSRGFEAGANAFTSLFGLRSQNKANRYATDVNARLMSEQVRLEQDRIRRQEEADAADRVDAERRWQAEQAFAAQQHAASEEERAYRRSLSERDVRLDDEREARRAVYRPYSERAMRTLGSILRIG